MRQNIQNALKVVTSDCRARLEDIGKIPKLSKGTVTKIMHDNMDMRKNVRNRYHVCSQWCKNNSKLKIQSAVCSCLLGIRKDFLERYTESKRASAELRRKGGSRPKRPKRHQSAGKVRPLCFLTSKELCFRRAKRSTATTIMNYWIAWLMNQAEVLVRTQNSQHPQQKKAEKASDGKEKTAVSPG